MYVLCSLITNEYRKMSGAENHYLIINDTASDVRKKHWNDLVKREKTVNLENNIFNSKIIIIWCTDL